MRDFRDYKKRGLSASEDGRGIVVTTTASPGTLVHTALTSVATNEWDEMTIWAVNTSGSAVNLTLEWGGTATSDQITVSVPNGGSLNAVIDGLVLHNSKEIRAYAGTADVIIIHGSARRYEQSL